MFVVRNYVNFEIKKRRRLKALPVLITPLISIKFGNISPNCSEPEGLFSDWALRSLTVGFIDSL